MTPLVEARAISKSFSGTRVLNRVSFSAVAGEVHAVMGENGAGKSTLMKILAGMHTPDGGEILIQGRKVEVGSVPAALKAGIAMISQEPLPFLDLSVAENIFMGQERASRLVGWVDKRAMRREAAEMLVRLGVELAPTRKMRELRVAEMQAVEIAKALAHGAEVIIMDEPTSALSEREVQALFRIIDDLRRQGRAVIYISHKLEEVFRLADRVTVLRDGSYVATHPTTELNQERLIALMVGRSVQAASPSAVWATGAVALSVCGLGKAGRFRDVSFEVRGGEVLGIAGLMGAGRTDVVNAIYGLDPAEAGEICVHGRPVRILSPRDALDAGIGLVTEDRKTYGFVSTMSVNRNLTLAALGRWCRAGFIDCAAENRIADEQVRAFGIKVRGGNQLVAYLSGGNQQKVVLARSLLTGPDVLLLDEPTRGIDIAAKAEVHAFIAQLAGKGKAIVLVSSELPELFSLSDRILVLRQGMITVVLDRRNTTPEEVLKFAIPLR
jgi:inositol transport system ATP-binding protein